MPEAERAEVCDDGFGILGLGYRDVVLLEGFDEGLCCAVRLWAAYWLERGSMLMSRSKGVVFFAMKQEPLLVSCLIGFGGMLMQPKRFCTVVVMRFCTFWLLMPSVVVTWAIAFRSQQLRAKVTRTFLFFVFATDLGAVRTPADV